MRTCEAHDLDVNRPIAAPLERCAQLLGMTWPGTAVSRHAWGAAVDQL